MNKTEILQRIVGVEAERVTKPMREEGSSDTALKDVFWRSGKDAKGEQAIDYHFVSMEVNSVPVNSWFNQLFTFLFIAGLMMSLSTTGLHSLFASSKPIRKSHHPPL